MTATFETFLEIDRALASRGFHSSSAWWLGVFERFYTHPTAWRLVVRAGRGSAKSFNLSKFAINELVFGDWPVPPGERHVFALVSIRTDEAMQRLRQISAMLEALGVERDVIGDEVFLRGEPRGVKVFSATVGSTSGPRAFGIGGDELAKWRSSDNAANPAKEVIASARAMTVTHPGAREFLVSSAFGTLDFHHTLVERGDGSDQVVAISPTWVANPSVTEPQTRELEPDERVWLREYASIPQAELSNAWPVDVVNAAFRKLDPAEGLTPAIAFGVDDPSSGRRDAWVSAVMRIYFRRPEPEYLERERGEWCGRLGIVRGRERILDAEGKPIPNPAYTGPTPPVLAVEAIEAAEGAFWQGLPAGELVKRRAAWYRQRGVATVFGDQREAYLLQSAYAEHGITYVPLTWTAESKVRAVERVRRWLAERTLVLPDNDRLKRELLGFRERVLPSGHITFDGQTDDHVAVLVTAALAELEGVIPASPLQRRSHAVDYSTLPDMS